MENQNYVCFFVPDSKILLNVLRLTDMEKAMLSAELLSRDVYNRILEFNSSGSIIVSVGSKTADKQAELVKQYEARFGKR